MPTQMGSNIFAGNQPDRGHAHRAAAARRRRDHPRQDHHVGVRLDRRQPQPADRHHAQSVEARLQRRRVVGRRGCRGGGGVRAAAPGQRRRRLDPHAVALLRRVRPEADVRPRAVLSGGQRRLHLAHGPDDAHRRRQRADAGGDGGTASARPHDLRGGTRGLSRPAARRRSRQAHRLQRRSRRCARRSRRRGAGEDPPSHASPNSAPRWRR